VVGIGMRFHFSDLLAKRYHNPPPRNELKTYIAVDFATSEGKGDYTAIVAFGLNPQGDIFVLDVWRRQASPDVGVDALLDMVRDFKPLVIVTEAGGLKNAIGPFLKERMNQRRQWCAVETIPSKHNKEIRSQSIAGRMAVRGLFIPASEPWVADLVAEILAFPAGRHDDQVDCMSLLGQLLGQLIVGRAPESTEPPKVLSTDPGLCTVTLTDLFEQSECRHRRLSCEDLVAIRNRNAIVDKRAHCLLDTFDPPATSNFDKWLNKLVTGRRSGEHFDLFPRQFVAHQMHISSLARCHQPALRRFRAVDAFGPRAILTERNGDGRVGLGLNGIFQRPFEA
jgi:predicted phage terminase large subunit-like protein